MMTVWRSQPESSTTASRTPTDSQTQHPTLDGPISKSAPLAPGSCYPSPSRMRAKGMSEEGRSYRLPKTPCDQVTVSIIKTETEACCACGHMINDRYLLKVNGRSWHAKCLRCTICQTALDKQPSCFVKEESVYCKADYVRQFGTKCAKCSRTISASDWVRRAREHVYHLACFACDSCKRQLSTGEEFALQDNRVLCKTHYMELLDGGANSNDENTDHDSQQRTKSKRVRTTFTDEQLQVLQANFSLDSNPDGQDLERIAQITGLSKRVTQVWFQNSRARQKKHQSTTTVHTVTAAAKRANGLSPMQATACPACGMMYCLCNHHSMHINMGQVH